MYKLLICTFVLLLISCGQESTPLSKELLVQSERDLLSRDCSGVNFHKDVFLKKNILAFFPCLGWSEEYKESKQFIESINERSFNKVVEPFNKTLYQNTFSRNNFLDFLSHNINITTTAEISKLIEVGLKDQSILKMANLYISKSVAKEEILPNIEILKKIFLIFRSFEAKSSEARLNFSKEYSDLSEQSNLRVENRELFIEIFNLISNNQREFFKVSKEILKNKDLLDSALKSLTQDEFEQIFYFPAKNLEYSKLSSRLREIIKSNEYNCSETQGVFSLNHIQELKARMESIKKDSQEVFLQNLIDLRLKFSLYNNICFYPELNHLVSVLLDDLIEFSLSKSGFLILKNISISMGDNPFALFDYAESDFFKSYQKLVVSDKKSKKIYNLLYPLFKNLDLKDITLIEQFIIEFENDQSWLQNFSVSWNKFSNEERHAFVLGVEELFILNTPLETFLNLLFNFLEEYEVTYDELILSLAKSNQEWVAIFETYFDSTSVLKQDIVKLFSAENIYHFFNLLFSQTGRDEVEVKNQEESVSKPVELEADEIQYERTSYQCLKDIHEKYIGDYNFWNIVNDFPKSCQNLSQKQKRFSTKVFEWTIDIEEVFAEISDKKFGIQYGFISGQMMSYYHTLIHLVNRHLNKEDDQYVGGVVETVRQHLFEYGLVDILGNSVVILENIIDLDRKRVDRSLNKLLSLEEKDFENSVDSILQAFLYKGNPAELTSAQDNLSPLIGERKSLTKEEVKELTLELKEILLRDNKGEKPLLNLLVDLFHPDMNIEIPYGRKKQRRFGLSLEELFTFLYDISDESTVEKIKYYSKGKVERYELNLARRLEIVIREISFLNNFYGAYFINRVSAAKSYTKNVKALKKNVKLLDKSSRYFRGRGTFPIETKYAFKNIYETYDSLWQLNSNGMTYGPLIQSILGVTVRSSSRRSQDFSPFQKPKPKLVEKHNGKFLTLLTQKSILTNLSSFVRKNFNKEEILNSNSFKYLNENFLKNISNEEVLSIFELFLKHENFELIINDVSEYVFEKENLTMEVEILFELLKLITTNQEKEIKITSTLSQVLDNYKEVRKSILVNIDKEQLSFMLGFLKGINALETKSRDSIQSILFYIMNDLYEAPLSEEFFDASFLESIGRTINLMGNYSTKTIKPTGMMEALITDENFSTKEILQFLKTIKLEDNNFEYLYTALRALAREKEGKLNLKLALENILNKHGENFEQFLIDLFDRFNDQREKN